MLYTVVLGGNMSKLTVSFMVAAFVVSTVSIHSAWAQMSSTTSDVSSTTSGSVKRIFVQNDKQRLQHFVDQNFERLQEAAAKGSGVILSDYVHLIGCSNTNGFMSNAIKNNYSRLFSEGKAQLVQQTEQMIEQDAELILACESQS